MVVCARRAVCGAPQVGARDQYIPEEGAGGTSGAVRGSARGGKGVCAWERRVRREEETVRPVPVEVELARMACGLLWEVTGGTEVEGLLAMAEVERKLVGCREEGPVLLPAEESCLSRRSCCACVWVWEASWWSMTWVAVGEFGVVVADKAGDGPCVLVDGGTAKEGAGGGLLALAEREAELLDGPDVAEDCERWRMASSDGLRRRS